MTEVERACEALVASLADDPTIGRFAGERAAVFVWSGGGDRILWSSGPDDVRTVDGRLRDRLGELGRGLAPRQGFRLERLRLRDSDGGDATYACRRVTLGADDALLTAQVKLEVAPRPHPVGANADPAPAVRTVADLSSVAGLPARTRFTWKASPEGRLLAVSPELAEAVGPASAAIVGRSWGELANGAIVAGVDRIAAAIAEGRAWTGILVLWRLSNPRFAIPVEIFGSPTRPGSGEPGFRGFGLCWTGRLTELPDEEDRPGFRKPLPFQAERPSAVRAAEPVIFDDRPNAASLAEPAPVVSAHAPAPPRGAALACVKLEPDPELCGDPIAHADVANVDAGAPVPTPELSLSVSERGALQEIARALGARLQIEETGQDDVAGLHAERAVALSSPTFDGETSRALDVAADGLAHLDDRGRILALNASACRLFGCGEDEVRGGDLARLLHPDSHRAALACLELARSGEIETAEVTARGGAEEGPRLMLRAGRSADAGSFLLAFHDITRFERIERELDAARREAEGAKHGQIALLARVSHEIRTPLNAIIGFAELMLGERFGPLGSDRYRDYADDIRESGGHVLSLINDLLDLARMTSGQGGLTPSAVDINAVVSGGVATLGPLALSERTIVRTSLSGRLPPVSADERSLKQITLNLLSNAIRYSGSGGQAIVSTTLGEHGDVVLRVRDTGPGMTPEEIETALTPFRQVAATRRDDGTGLGLPLSKAMVEANGGVFAVTSRRGAGTLVEIRLPAARPAQEPDRIALPI